MKFEEWLVEVPAEITNVPIWKLDVYCLTLFAGDIGWNDILALSKNKLMWSIADQLHRSLDSISANLSEGYSRSKGLEWARFIEFSLDSARESRDWYYKSRHVLPSEVVKHRMGLMTRIVDMLVPMISCQRAHAIHEDQAEYKMQTLDFHLDAHIPLP